MSELHCFGCYNQAALSLSDCDCGCHKQREELVKSIKGKYSGLKDQAGESVIKCGHPDRAMDSLYTCADCFNEKDKEIARLKSDISIERQILAERTSELAEAVMKREELEAELKEAREEIAILKHNLTQCHGIIEDAKAALKAAREQISTLVKEINECPGHQRLLALMEEIETLKYLQDISKKQYEKVLVEIERKDAIIKAAQSWYFSAIRYGNNNCPELFEAIRVYQALSRNGEEKEIGFGGYCVTCDVYRSTDPKDCEHPSHKKSPNKTDKE